MPASAPDHVDHILAQWRRELPDLNVSPLGIFGRLFRVAHLADAALGRALSQHDVQPGWFDLLAALRRAGAPYELNPTELARTTLLSSGGMTKRLDRMVEAGLLERRPDPSDRRGTLVTLTARGKAAVDGALEAHVANEEQLLSSLTRTQQRTLDDLLHALLVDLERSDAALRKSPDRAT
jgi:DNA-binding MarR family transcriptional regulator